MNLESLYDGDKWRKVVTHNTTFTRNCIFNCFKPSQKNSFQLNSSFESSLIIKLQR
jgi:hypothetical protein